MKIRGHSGTAKFRPPKFGGIATAIFFIVFLSSQIQRRATTTTTRLMLSDKSLVYYERLRMLGLTTLETRRLRDYIIEVFKISQQMAYSLGSVVSDSIKIVRIFAGVLQKEDIKRQRVNPHAAVAYMLAQLKFIRCVRNKSADSLDVGVENYGTFALKHFRSPGAKMSWNFRSRDLPVLGVIGLDCLGLFTELNLLWHHYQWFAM